MREEAVRRSKEGRKAKMQRMKRRKTFEEACERAVWEKFVSRVVKQALEAL